MGVVGEFVNYMPKEQVRVGRGRKKVKRNAQSAPVVGHRRKKMKRSAQAAPAVGRGRKKMLRIAQPSAKGLGMWEQKIPHTPNAPIYSPKDYRKQTSKAKKSKLQITLIFGNCSDRIKILE